MTETLACKECGESWTRELVRGRKPTKCASCKSKSTPSAPSKSGSETLDRVEEDFKVRLNGGKVSSSDIKFLGTPKAFKNLMVYSGWETSAGTFVSGCEVRETGFSDRYKVTNVMVRADGSAYVNLTGVSGLYMSKYRAIDVRKLRA
jgi:hypothetical protein